MRGYAFEVRRSHPQLTWLVNAGIRNRAIPAHVVQNLARLVTHERAQEFVASAGLRVVTTDRREHSSVNAVAVTPPDFSLASGKAEYYGPEIALPKIALKGLPFGTALMNCLLPKIEEKPTAERIFQAYQAMILAFSRKLDAIPFACITGYKSETEERPHDLYHRGFRFFYSPEPDVLYERIFTSLKAFHDLVTLPPDAEQTEKSRLVAQIQGLKFCRLGESGQIGSAILEDIKFQTADTVLVDLRTG